MLVKLNSIYLFRISSSETKEGNKKNKKGKKYLWKKEKTAVTLTLQLTNRTMSAAGDWNNGLPLTAGHHTGQYVTGPKM